jgi:hypothetical protein
MVSSVIRVKVRFKITQTRNGKKIDGVYDIVVVVTSDDPKFTQTTFFSVFVVV